MKWGKAARGAEYAYKKRQELPAISIKPKKKRKGEKTPDSVRQPPEGDKTGQRSLAGTRNGL